MNNNKIIAVIGAMDCEIEQIVGALNNVETTIHGSLKIYFGKILDNLIIVAKSGVGKVNAALCTQYVIDTYKPDCIINSGIAGGINLNLKIYDVVVGEKLVQHDFDATVLGYVKGYMCTGIEPQKPTEFHSDKNLIAEYLNSAGNSNVIVGTIATGDMFISSNDKKKELRMMFNADAAEMEAAAIAQVANANNIPCLIVRTIADLADDKAAETNKATEKELANHSALSIIPFIKKLCDNS